MNFQFESNDIFAAGEFDKTDSEVIVLVHGAAMDHCVWAFHTRYFRYIDQPVLAIDLPGHGRSTGTPLASIPQAADWLLAFTQNIGVETLCLAGHSMGALIALEAAARGGGRISRLALLGFGFPMAVSDLLLDAADDDRASAEQMMTVWGNGHGAHIGANPVAGLRATTFSKRLLERAADGVLHTDLSACQAYEGGIEAARNVSCPVTIISGSDDKMTPARNAQATIEALKNARQTVIPNSGHMLSSEQPEATHQALVAALAA
ncbi:MAG: alpha/beta hydrolase [Pseudomonadota bacterium]